MRESLGEKTSFETAQLFLVNRLAGLPVASRIESRMGRVLAHDTELISSSLLFVPLVQAAEH